MPTRFIIFKCIFILIINWCLLCRAYSQRVYASESVLATKTWYKISASKEGIYKIDLPFLSACGINTNSINSVEIKIYSNNQLMLQEACNGNFTDDLIEIPIQMFDGGDGIFNGNDYLLFYAKPVDAWIKDSLNKTFKHLKNLYADSCFYFLNISAGNGKRIVTNNTITNPNLNVSTYNERYFYEKDLVNFLSSGKNWYGEEFSLITGNNLHRNFKVDWQGINTNYPITLTTSFVARSVGTTANISVFVNNQIQQTHNIPAVTGGFLDVFANSSIQTNQFTASQSLLNIGFSYKNPTTGGQLWLDWFELNGRRNLSFNNSSQFSFRDWESVGASNIARFNVLNATENSQIWEITNPLQPTAMLSQFNNSQISFTNDASYLKEYIAFDGNSFLLPNFVSQLPNQNLHQTAFYNDIIITHPSILSEANRLALFHINQYGYKTVVITTSQIFNEFSAGNADPTAIRNFLKMLYDRANGDTSKQPKSILFFGSASYDYKSRINNNTNLVCSYESDNSLDPLSTYTTDDFFGYLNNIDDINNSANSINLAVSVGRLPAKNVEEAKLIVDKIIEYHEPIGLGNWRNNITFIADDGDNNLHLNDAETVASTTQQTDSALNINKIYLDAFKLQSGSSGGTYPEVNTAIINSLNKGNIICNFTGHGGSKQLAEEAVFTFEDLKKINNIPKLPLFITATCDFDAYDNPAITSLGHSLLFNNLSGAIGLMASTRVVFASSNKIINNNYLSISLKKNPAGKFLTLGEAIKQTKNISNITAGDIINTRKFALLGDPAMKLSLPELNANIVSVNGNSLSNNDTLKPLNEYKLSGTITDNDGTVQTNFSGTVYPTIFNQPQIIQTLGNSPQSIISSFSTQNNILFKGKASVTNGRFDVSFIIPKDVGVAVGKAKISLYADNRKIDAAGLSTHFFIGGTTSNHDTDNTPPTIKAYINDEKFVNGGLVNETPVILLKLFDSSGINTSGLGIGHDITLMIDGKESNIIVLNNYYEALLNSYKVGQVRFQMPNLSQGKHFASVKVWDIANNSSTATIEFEVANEQQLVIKNVYNYPNPFTSKTAFMFEHNQPGEDIFVQINIYSVSGKLVHQINKVVNTVGNLCNDIFWDGKDKSNEKLANGVYIYTIIANSKNGRTRKTQKLFLL